MIIAKLMTRYSVEGMFLLARECHSGVGVMTRYSVEGMFLLACECHSGVGVMPRFPSAFLLFLFRGQKSYFFTHEMVKPG